MQIQFKNEYIYFEEEGKNNLISNVKIGTYENVEIDIIINQFTRTINNIMISNILEYCNNQIVYLESEFKPLLNELLLKQYAQLNTSIEINKIEFDFCGIWIKSMEIFNSQFELIYYLNGKNNYPNLDVNGKWALAFSGSINQWHISGVNRIV